MATRKAKFPQYLPLAYDIFRTIRRSFRSGHGENRMTRRSCTGNAKNGQHLQERQQVHVILATEVKLLLSVQPARTVARDVRRDFSITCSQ